MFRRDDRRPFDHRDPLPGRPRPAAADPVLERRLEAGQDEPPALRPDLRQVVLQSGLPAAFGPDLELEPVGLALLDLGDERDVLAPEDLGVARLDRVNHARGGRDVGERREDPRQGRRHPVGEKPERQAERQDARRREQRAARPRLRASTTLRGAEPADLLQRLVDELPVELGRVLRPSSRPSRGRCSSPGGCGCPGCAPRSAGRPAPAGAAARAAAPRPSTNAQAAGTTTITSAASRRPDSCGIARSSSDTAASVPTPRPSVRPIPVATQLDRSRSDGLADQAADRRDVRRRVHGLGHGFPRASLRVRNSTKRLIRRCHGRQKERVGRELNSISNSSLLVCNLSAFDPLRVFPADVRVFSLSLRRPPPPSSGRPTPP